MKTLKQFLEEHKACLDGFEFAKDLTLEQFLNTCERGDWILWLFARMNPDSKRQITLAKGQCANTVRHLMKDKRSLDAVDIAIKYGNNEATEQELATAATVAALAAAYAAFAADTAAYAAKKDNQKLTADICRKYLPLAIWDQSKL